MWLTAWPPPSNILIVSIEKNKAQSVRPIYVYFEGHSFIRVNDQAIPMRVRTNQKYWRLNLLRNHNRSQLDISILLFEINFKHLSVLLGQMSNKGWLGDVWGGVTDWVDDAVDDIFSCSCGVGCTVVPPNCGPSCGCFGVWLWSRSQLIYGNSTIDQP